MRKPTGPRDKTKQRAAAGGVLCPTGHGWGAVIAHASITGPLCANAQEHRLLTRTKQDKQST